MVKSIQRGCPSFLRLSFVSPFPSKGKIPGSSFSNFLVGKRIVGCFFDKSKSFCYDPVKFASRSTLYPWILESGPFLQDARNRMRGQRLPRQRCIIRAVEASPNGLTVPEISHRGETGFRKIYRDLDALQGAGFPLHAQSVEKANPGPSSKRSESTTR